MVSERSEDEHQPSKRQKFTLGILWRARLWCWAEHKKSCIIKLMGKIQSYLGAISLNSVTGLLGDFSGPQILFAGVILVFLLLYGISLGRTRALISLLGIYIAFVFDTTFVYLRNVNNLIRFSPAIYITRIVLFLAVYFIVFFILNRSIVKSRLTLKEVSFISVFVISVLQLGLLISIITNMLPAEVLSIFPSFFSNYFATKTALFYWGILPVVILLFMRNKKRNRVD